MNRSEENLEKRRRMQKVFDSDEGKLVLEDLKKACHFYNTTQSDSPYETAYKEGERSAILRIVKTLEADLEEEAKRIIGN